jgi:hypothetical protein
MRLHYDMPNILSKLHDELISAGIISNAVEGLGNDIWITMPDLTSQIVINQISAIVNAHNPTPYQQSPTIQEQLLSIQNDFDIMYAQMLMLQGVAVNV